ncbi:MAG: signal peptide peptidase SppA, partial [Candidatus Sumerlaeia bacterium]|nr:signal peptide peptidase SppA [Candidatus Sumerlaeia bacterium]
QQSHQQPPRGAAPPPPPPPPGYGPPQQQGPPPGYGQMPPGGGYRPPAPPPGWGGPPQGPKPRNRAIPLIIGLVILFVVVGGGLIGLIGASSMSSGGSGGGFMGDRIAVLEINGVLGEGPNYQADTKKLVNQVRAWERNPRIKALVLRINSPGGAVSATQDLYHELQNFRDSGRPVVASLGDIAASGGYYAAIAADEIYANEGSLTGSIGVIMNFFNFEGFQETIGIHSRTIKSGKFKDIGSGSRAMTLEERELLGDMVDDVYEQFLEAVVAGRQDAVRILLADTLGKDTAEVSMAEIEEHLRKYSDGRIFSGRQAKEYSMIDSVGTLQQAIARARELAGLPETAGITKGPPRPTGLFGGLGAISNRLQTLPAMDELGSVRLEYRFAGF